MNSIAPPSKPFRIHQIEGLRGYLSLWVLLSHVIVAAGCSFPGVWAYLEELLRSGNFAVDIFIMVSGFVIALLLDCSRQGYVDFILARFFRIWPLFIVLFLVAIPLSLIELSNISTMEEVLQGAREGDAVAIENAWKNLTAHIVLHVPMLHGIPPQEILADSPTAFLTPAWSLSLEWQFYLIAPVVFGFLLSPRRFAIEATIAVCVACLVLAKLFWKTNYGAFLPLHLDFFFFGALSYWAYRRLETLKRFPNLIPASLGISVFVFLTSGRNLELLPICFWAPFLCLIIDCSKSRPSAIARCLSRAFDNKVSIYVGRISYSIYLCHTLVIILSQRLLFAFWPNLSHLEHFLSLLGLTLVGTLIASHLLYHLIEFPGIRFGKVLRAKIKNRAEA